MLKTLVLVLVSALALSASADGSDIQAQIDACRHGMFDGRGGCEIEIPRGVTLVRETIVSGGDSSSTAQNGLQVRGVGVADLQMQGSNAATGGSILQWAGEPGGTVWEHKGGTWPSMENFSIGLDPGNLAAPGGKVFDGTLSAGVGIKISANNSRGAPTQMGLIRRVNIEGSRDAEIQTSIGVLVTGERNDDQVDGLLMEQIVVTRVGVALRNENQQAVLIKVDSSKLDGYYRAVQLIEGALSIVDSQLICRRTVGDCVYVETGPKAGYLRLIRPYMEIQDQRAVFLLGGGSQVQNSYGSKFSILVDGGYLNLQCDSSKGHCQTPLVDGHQRGDITFRNNDFASAGGRGPVENRRFTVSGSTYSQHPRDRFNIRFDGNEAHPALGTGYSANDPIIIESIGKNVVVLGLE